MKSMALYSFLLQKVSTFYVPEFKDTIMNKIEIVHALTQFKWQEQTIRYNNSVRSAVKGKQRVLLLEHE